MGSNDQIELVSVRTLAKVLDCSPKTIRDWLYKNRRNAAMDPLPYYRLGGLIRFNLTEVVAWVSRHRVRVGALSVFHTDTVSSPKRMEPSETL
jgi:excisionase family DNA binding protein